MANGLVAGIDGCKGGWAVALFDGRAISSVARWGTFEEVLGAIDAECIGVDIPIGLPERGYRAADLAARKLLGKARSRVFLTPPRRVLLCGTYEEANTLSRALYGHGVSRQAYGLRRKILEVDAVFDSHPAIHEVFPELTYYHLAENTPLVSKKSGDGLRKRRALLHSVGAAPPAEIAETSAMSADDVMDACAAAYSAWRIRMGQALSAPTGLDVDGRGRPMMIWY